MLSLLAALTSLTFGGVVAPPPSDQINVSKRIIYLDVPSQMLSVTLRTLLDLAHVKYRFEPEALAIASSLRRTACFRGVTINEALWHLVSRYNLDEDTLDIRKVNGFVVIGEPRVSVYTSDQDAGYAIFRLFRGVGCDYCADLSAMGKRHISIELRDVPISEAFRKVMHQISPPVAHELVFRHGFYLVMTRSPLLHVGQAPDTREVVVRIEGHDRAEAIAAACECLHRSYVINIDGAITGTVTVRNVFIVDKVDAATGTMTAHNDTVDTADKLFLKLIKGTPDGLTFEDTGEFLLITREDVRLKGDLLP